MQTANVNDISTRALLVTLNISRWRARKTDKRVNKEVAANHGTTENIGNYRKDLLPAEAAAYEAIGKVENAARADHYAQTLPWCDSGARILTAANFATYAALMQEHTAVFNKAVREFVTDYPDMREAARKYLNGLYRESDYPAPANMPGLFKFDVKNAPIPTGNDFRVELPDISDIRVDIQAATDEAVQDAMKDAWTRLCPIWAEMETRRRDGTLDTDSEVDLSPSRRVRFVRFRRIIDINVQFADLTDDRSL